MARWFAAMLLAILIAIVPDVPRAASQPAIVDAVEPLIEAARSQAAAPCHPGDRLVAILCEGRLRVGVRRDYPNFGLEDAVGFSGYEIDLAGHIAGRLGVALRLVPVTPATRIAALGEDKVDLVIATMGHTVDRDGQARFIRPHYYASETVVVGPRPLAVSGWPDLAGATVCVTIGNSSNATFVEHNVRLLLFNTPSQLLEQLEQSTCTLIAQDDSFFAAPFARPDFARRYDVKLGFGTLPWGMAVAQTETRSLANVLSLLSEEYHRDGTFLAMARSNHVGTDFLQRQQAVWERPDCNRAAGTAAPPCMLPPTDGRLARLAIAQSVERLEARLADFGLHVSLPMFKTVVAFDLFVNGLAYTLILVFGAIACTAAIAFGFAWLIRSGPRPVAFVVRWLALFFRSSPIVLLLFAGLTAATAVAQYSAASALFVAIVTLGLVNGCYGAHAITQVHTELVRERDGVKPPFLLLASRSAVPLTSFLINASKGSAAASMIGAPELLNATTDISSFSNERLTLYSLLLLLYLGVVLLVISLCKVSRRYLRRVARPA